jgi:hypothetical protein
MAETEGTRIASVDIYQYGIFKGKPIEIIDNPTSITGKESKVSIRGFKERTLQIPATLGTHFGIIYVVKGKPDGTDVYIRLKISHPPMKNPETKKNYTFTDSIRLVKIGAHEFHGWLFENKWEIVPGQYFFQIFDNNKELGKKTFTVYLPQIRTDRD